ncbi:MAG: hypothetical protein NTX03_02580, partial [Bacteroidetes bacterium]|nr:hypothetical protein [Bacteroidota bacterium]
DHKDSRSYVFGKLNNCYLLKGSFGGKSVLADKNNEKAIRISVNYTAGAVLCLLKPAYFEIAKDNNENTPQYQKFNAVDDKQHTNIIGKAPIEIGITEMGGIMGLGGKTSLSFEMGKTPLNFYFIELGATIDAFPVAVPIFAYENNQRIFVNLFVAVGLGKRN